MFLGQVDTGGSREKQARVLRKIATRNGSGVKAGP